MLSSSSKIKRSILPLRDLIQGKQSQYVKMLSQKEPSEKVLR